MSSSAIVWTMLGGVVVGAGVVVTPRFINASTAGAGEAVTARVPEHQALLDQFASVLARSHAVLGVHPATDSPMLDIGLWIDDQSGDGVVNTTEFAVISWSRSLQALTYHTMPSLDVLSKGDPLRRPDELKRGDREACRAMRQHPEATTQLLARGLSDVSIEMVESSPSDHTGMGRLRITLTWRGNSVDGEDKASTVVDVSLIEDTGRR
ncbi:MAG: hypothetical protein KC983_01830 [Phycisphaerales bacterium]|nr:hypothetical protein [Phycisphaerales bacterium]